MPQNKIDILTKMLAREKAARKAAEAILEEKSLELYQVNARLQESNRNLSILLEDQKIELAGLFDSMHDGYFLVDLYGEIIKYNKSANQFFSISEREIQNIQELIPQEDKALFMSHYKNLLNVGFLSPIESRVKRGNGALSWIESTLNLIRDKSENIVFILCVFRDISESKRMNLEKEHLVSELQFSNRELKDFAYVVSHDLKSPLRSMNTLLNWISDEVSEKLSKDSSEFMSLLFEKIDRMDQLINALIDYSKVDRVDDQIELTDLNTVLDQVKVLVTIPEHAKLIKDNELPKIRLREVHAKQLFQNLISNGLKYCDSDKGEVRVASYEIDENYIISISDNGNGIENKYFSKIFEIFQSLDPKSNSTGIGLSIVKKIMDYYKGEVWVESEIGKGATFYLKFVKDEQ